MASAPSNNKIEEIKTLAENDLYAFISLVAPHRVLGEVHKELIYWLTRPEGKSHKLVLMPRDHQKSALAAYYAAWEITKNPAITILYLSATTPLALDQLRAIKQILTSDKYKKYWPEMLDVEEGKRDEWAAFSFRVDHPKRKKEGVRDSTCRAASITTNITGFHCNLAILDDVVIRTNAYTEENRKGVIDSYSFLASVEHGDAREVVVGTRYHHKDLYNVLINMKYELFDENGNSIEEEPVYEVFERVVEDSPERNGSGNFIWPRQRRQDGKYFGFNQEILAKKKAQYQDTAQYFSQYYNDPSDPSSSRIDSNSFNYYKKEHLSHDGLNWRYNGQRLNIYAGMDFAWTLNKKSDYTALAVIGITPEADILILELDRFRTDKVSEMWDHVLKAHYHWGMRRLRAESNMGQKIIVNQFQEYVKQQGSLISVDPVYRTRHEGTKLERVTAVLEPRYAQGKVWHYRGGNCQVLEEELINNFPEHDDLQDALASAIEIAKPPTRFLGEIEIEDTGLVYNTRFGGIAG